MIFFPILAIVIIGAIFDYKSINQDKTESNTYEDNNTSDDSIQTINNNIESDSPYTEEELENNPPYTEEELENDSTAPSTNPDDYNADGEYVPEDGPTNNPADYNSDGEYKPAEDMTQEEIEQELMDMLDQ